MANLLGILCVSVDSQEANELSIETAHRRRELIELLQRFEIPSNWTVAGNRRIELPANAEITVGVPKSVDRPELVKHLRAMSAILLRDAATLNSVVFDPHEARSHWDVLVRHGCVVARPRTAAVTTDTGPRILRGGLWVAPMSCSFVGGSKRSVRSLFGVCQRRLVESAALRQPFHLTSTSATRG